MTRRLAYAFVLGKALFPSSMPEKERVAKLAPHFSPAVGGVATLDALEIHKAAKKDPLQSRGFIVVTPPKGQCWIIKRNHEMKDTNVCERSVLHFAANDIDDEGKINWEVITGQGDFGTPLTWKTPYRLAQVIANERFAHQMSDFVPVHTCKAEPDTRKITVELLTGEKWVIHFPPQDTLIFPQPKDPPNLYVRVEEATGFKDKDAPKLPAPPGVERYPWVLSARATFVMPASGVKMADSPDGLNGLCRYRLVGAPRDPAAGALECFNTEKYDAFYLPLTCSPALAARDSYSR